MHDLYFRVRTAYADPVVTLVHVGRLISQGELTIESEDCIAEKGQ